jgi:hypothetical protein
VPNRINIARRWGATWGTAATVVLALGCIAFLVLQG